MELGEKLKNARLEAGLSQRQLCGEEITRNMLSQIEHGTARPSMDTLRYLAARLEKPVSFFLEEDGVFSPNREVMEQVRNAFGRGEHGVVLEALKAYREPDPVYGTERKLLEALALLGAAEQAIREDRLRYARELLTRMEAGEDPYTCHLRRRRLLLLAKTGEAALEVCRQLPDLDEELLLRAEAALAAGDARRAGALLDAAQEQTVPRWHLLRGDGYVLEGDYEKAARCYHRAEDAQPQLTAPKLERCYRELGDYKRAYAYACKQRSCEKL